MAFASKQGMGVPQKWRFSFGVPFNPQKERATLKGTDGLQPGFSSRQAEARVRARKRQEAKDREVEVSDGAWGPGRGGSHKKPLAFCVA